MGTSIGKKITFWTLVKDRITIPTIQRDYIYGAGTEKTEEVLTHMLKTFKVALETCTEETLDFVYGSQSKANEFMPLDGQQRLTTLYLLHYYAAIIANRKEESAEVEEKEFELLNRFSYATRNTTVSFCSKLLIEKHKDIKNVVLDPSNNNEHVISSFLKDLDEFRGSFFTDPSVMSMLVVLDRIHQEFKGMDTMWERLKATDCPINFYQLDFGKFDLSDDLYNKMNSRGKPLSGFEVFKAKIHKQINALYPKLAEDIAIKMDTCWMQFIWEALSRTSDLKAVDPAFMWSLKNLFRSFDYIKKNDKQSFEMINDECIKANTIDAPWRIRSMETVFDTFAKKCNNIPSELKSDYDSLIKDATGGNLRNNRMLSLYAFYLGLYRNLDETEFSYRYRHVRNIINNSSDQIRETAMCDLMSDVRSIINGFLLSNQPKAFNKGSWEEEQEKERNRLEWERLFEFEDIDEINGSLLAFCYGLNPTNSFNLGDAGFVRKLVERLKKASHFFKTEGLYEHERRSALLAIGSYAMCKRDAPNYRYFGVIKSSWQNFTGFHTYDDRHCLMEIIDQIDENRPIRDYINDYSKTATENWRYYAKKYAEEITVAYRQVDYGYMYFSSVDTSHPYNNSEGYLDVIILQSTYFSSSNVAWKMMNRLVELKYSNKYHMFLYHQGASHILLSKISRDVKLDIRSDGWHILGISPEDLHSAGISCNTIKSSEQFDCLINHITGKDYVEEGGEILDCLSNLYPALRK